MKVFTRLVSVPRKGGDYRDSILRPFENDQVELRKPQNRSFAKGFEKIETYGERQEASLESQ